MKLSCAGALAAGVLLGAPLDATAAARNHHPTAITLPHAGPVLGAAVAGHMMRTSGAVGRALDASQAAGSSTSEPMVERIMIPGTTPSARRPWIEGYQPSREDELFRAVYPSLPSHNVLKVYASDAGNYSAAGIRFSARVPHSMRDISAVEMKHEAVTLIRTVFDRFPNLQTLDVWSTIPVSRPNLMRVESTVFSISADRDTYLAIRDHALSDDAFLTAFGRMWIAPQVPR